MPTTPTTHEAAALEALPYVLTAEREGHVVPVAVCGTLRQAAALVEWHGEEDDEDGWPEGYDAVLTDPSGRRLLYASGWEEA